MEAWVYIKVTGKEVVILGLLHSVRELADEMLVDSACGSIREAGDIALRNYAECCTLEGHQFKYYRGYIRVVNV